MNFAILIVPGILVIVGVLFSVKLTTMCLVAVFLLLTLATLLLFDIQNQLEYISRLHEDIRNDEIDEIVRTLDLINTNANSSRDHLLRQVETFLDSKGLKAKEPQSLVDIMKWKKEE